MRNAAARPAGPVPLAGDRPVPVRWAGDRPRPRTPATADRLYFRQLLAGRDFAADDQIARQMVNFVYLIGDRATGEALIVDPAYGVDELLDILRADDMRCVGALATHFHPDHVGGDMMGWGIEGITRLLEVTGCRCTSRRTRPRGSIRTTGVGAGDLVHAPRRGRGPGGRRPDHAGPHPGPHSGEPVLPGRRPADRR